MNYNKLFMLLISFKLILNQIEKCTSIINCVKCPMPNVCSQCKYGYVLKSDLSQCLISNNNINQNATINSQNNSPSGSISSNSQNNFTENFASNTINNCKNETTLNSNNSSNKSHSIKTFNLTNENIALNLILIQLIVFQSQKIYLYLIIYLYIKHQNQFIPIYLSKANRKKQNPHFYLITIISQMENL